MRPTLFAATSLLALSTSAFASNWEIDSAHSSASFKVRHLMISNVPGRFSGVQGKVELDDKDISKSKVQATIDVKTINTDNTKRDEHLRSPDFFDTAKFPTMQFQSKSVKQNADGSLTVTGALTMHGVTKDTALAVTNLTPESKDPFGGVRRGMTAITKINRKDFGLNWNKALETGGVVVGDEVDVTIDAELVKK